MNNNIIASVFKPKSTELRQYSSAMKIVKRLAAAACFATGALHLPFAHAYSSYWSDWQKCANQNQTCSVPANSIVQYRAANGRYTEIEDVTGGISCTDSVFGNPGPAPKSCVYKPTPGGFFPISGKTPNAVVGLPNWYTFTFPNNGYTPVMLAQMQTTDSSDPAGVRVNNLTQASVQVVIEEETSRDTELGHTSEVVGFLGFRDGDITNSDGEIIGHAVKTLLTQSNGSYSKSVAFRREYDNPVVVATMTSFRGSQPAQVQVFDVTNNGFRFRVREWDYLDQGHATEDISYIVIEAGEHIMPNGQLLIADHVYADGNFATKNFPHTSSPFLSAPLVFTQPVTLNENSGFVTRVKSIDAQSFQLRLQEEEASNGARAREQVAYVAMGSAALKERWYVTKKNFTTSVTSIGQAESLFNSPPSGTKTNSFFTQVINFNEIGGGEAGRFFNDEAFATPFRGSPDNYVVKATTSIEVEETGYYRFGVNSDDGFRLKLNSSVIAEHSGIRAPADTVSNPIQLQGGRRYYLDLLYFEAGGGAALELFMYKNGTQDYHLVQGGMNSAVDDIDNLRQLNVASSDNDEGFNILRPNDRIRNPENSSVHARMQEDGNFVVYNGSTAVWASDTQAAASGGWRDSLHHANQCGTAVAEFYGDCDRGHAVKIDQRGLYIINDAGMIIWMPDLGDLTDTDTSRGFSLQFLSGTVDTLGLVNNATGHVRWDSKKGYRPIRKAVSALFTAHHPSATWQHPHTAAFAGTIRANGNDLVDYIPESMRQRSVMSFHPGEDSDALVCANCDEAASTQYRVKLTRSGDLRIISYNRSTGATITSRVWSAQTNSGANNANIYAVVTHTGLELRDARNNHTTVWRAVSGLPSSNYMLRLFQASGNAVPHLELWDMEREIIVWDTIASSTTRNNHRNLMHGIHFPRVIKDTMDALSKTRAANHHLNQQGYKVLAYGWDHLNRFVQSTSQWNDFQNFANDASHLRLHDAFSDLEQLRQDTVDDAQKLAYDYIRIMNVIRQIRGNQSLLDRLRNSPELKAIWELIKDPDTVVVYVEQIVDALKEGAHKAEVLKEIVNNSDSFSDAFHNVMNEVVPGGRDALEKKAISSLEDFLPQGVINQSVEEHHRSLQSGNPLDASCDAAPYPRLCRYLTRHPTQGLELSFEAVLNLVGKRNNAINNYALFTPTPADAERGFLSGSRDFFASNKTLTHSQIRILLLPLSHLRDVNGDGTKELVQTMLRIQTLQISALMKFATPGSASLGFIGPYALHSWTIPVLARDRNGSRVSTRSSASYTSSAGIIARTDLTLSKLLEPVKRLGNALVEGASQLQNMNEFGGFDFSSAANATRTIGQEVQQTANATTTPTGPAASQTGFLAGVKRYAKWYDDHTTGSLTFVGLGGIQAAFRYRDMTPYEIAALHSLEAVGTLLVPFVFELFGVGFDLDTITENPIASFNIESMMGSGLATTAFFVADSAYHKARGEENRAPRFNIFAAANVGWTLSLNFKYPGKTFPVMHNTWSHAGNPGGASRGESYYYAPRGSLASGTLVNKFRFRARWTIGASYNLDVFDLQ